MLDYRSPTFLLLAAGVFFALGFAAFVIDGESKFAWLLLLLALPPVFEAEVSRYSARIASMVYDRGEQKIEHLAFKPIGSLLRCFYLFLFFTLAYVLGRDGLNLLPDNGWLLPFLLVPIAIHLIWAGVANWRDISSIARREGWRKRRAKVRK